MFGQRLTEAELVAKAKEEPLIPADLARAKSESLKIINEYQTKRIDWYQKVKLKDILRKDIAMFAARGVATADDFVKESFRAVESSSEETMMGNHWHQILAAISENTLDTGDLTTEREGVIWVCEIKSQPNTTNSSSFPQELRSLRTRRDEIKNRRRVSKQDVKVAYCVLRDPARGGKGYDEMRRFPSESLFKENEDLSGFEYRYISGKQFWKWMSGFDSEVAILMPLSDLHAMGHQVAVARDNAEQRLRQELHVELTAHGLGTTIDDVVKLRDLYR